MTFEENIEAWEAIAAKARGGSAAAAAAMARYIAWRTARDTLTRSYHASGAWHRTRPGEPPARASGKLAKGMFATPASGGLRASASVGNRECYSRALEFGSVLEPMSSEYMHWKDSGGPWYHEYLMMRPHPFLEPTVREAIDDGELQQVAIDAFRPYDP